MIENLLEYCDVYRQGNIYVIIQTGMPEMNSRMGGGESLQEAFENLDNTPYQCTGRDSGASMALQYAISQQWFEDPEEDDSVLPIRKIKDQELYEDPDTGELVEDLTEIEDRLNAEIETVAREGQEKWTGWDWNHDPGGVVIHGPGAIDDWDEWEKERLKKIDMEDIECALSLSSDESTEMTISQIEEARKAIATAERDYGEQAQHDAESASQAADDAIRSAKNGKWTDALEHAETAASIESEYGDCPAYDGLVKLIKHALELLE